MSTAQNSTTTKPPGTGMALKIVAYVGLGVLVLVLGFAGYVATLPDDFRVERSAEISAPADAVFPLIDNFHEWSQWSPWEELDPNLERKFEGPQSGKGAIYSWNGNDKVGAGKMTILDSKPGESVTIKLEFIKPFAAVSETKFKLAKSDAGTKVSWIMEGKNNFFAKAMCVFMNMDKMVGKDFEKGLDKMNTAAQKVASEKPAATEKK